MRKTTIVLVIIIVAAAVAGGGYLLLRKPATVSSPSNKSGTAASTNNQSSQTPDVNNTVVITKSSTAVGKYLADPSGKPLYTYGNDMANMSMCTGACLAQWPAYEDTGATTGLPANITTFKRSDNGKTQYAYKGKPLYYFVTDTSGTVTGDGVDQFNVARP